MTREADSAHLLRDPPSFSKKPRPDRVGVGVRRRGLPPQLEWSRVDNPPRYCKAVQHADQ